MVEKVNVGVRVWIGVVVVVVGMGQIRNVLMDQNNLISCFWVYTNRLISCFCVVFWCLYHACSSRL